MKAGASGDELDRYADSRGWPTDAARQAVMELLLEGDVAQTPEGIVPRDFTVEQFARRAKNAESFNVWFDRFLEEKQLPYASWEIRGADGTPHYIDSDVVIETIKGAPSHEQAQIKDMIVRLDFANADINDYFHHLAKAIIDSFGGAEL
jgi:hypothetical protein